MLGVLYDAWMDGVMEAAPEAKAVRLFPTMYPPATVLVSQIVDPAQADIDLFMDELDKAFKFVPHQRGVAPGGSRGEYWSWMPQYENECHEVKHLLLRVAFGRVPPLVLKAFLSARALAQDRPEDTDKYEH